MRVLVEKNPITWYSKEKALPIFRLGEKEDSSLKKTTLVIMAAGIGSRYGGGIKQLAKIEEAKKKALAFKAAKEAAAKAAAEGKESAPMAEAPKAAAPKADPKDDKGGADAKEAK